MSHSEYSKMSSYGLNASVETPVPLNGIVNNALLNTNPNINQTLPQIVHILRIYRVWQNKVAP